MRCRIVALTAPIGRGMAAGDPPPWTNACLTASASASPGTSLNSRVARATAASRLTCERTRLAVIQTPDHRRDRPT